jgi:hypothetical protein
LTDFSSIVKSQPATDVTQSASEIVSPSRYTRAFLDQLFGVCPPDLYVLIWQLGGKRSSWFTVAQLDRAAEFAAGQENVYVGAALSPANFGPKNRCESDRAAGIIGLWVDIDVKGPAHKEAALPPTMGHATALALSLDIFPTIRVNSGHGLQAYWLFNEPWIFADDAERDQARRLVANFIAALRSNAGERGWKLDGVKDLARVLRVPGTINSKPKCPPVPVRLIDAAGPRYDRADLIGRFREQSSIPSSNDCASTSHRTTGGRDSTPSSNDFASTSHRTPGTAGTFILRVPATVEDRELALSALAGLNISRADPYSGDGGWLDVGMALHSVDSSDAMCGEWDRWSSRSSHYEEGVCAAKWATFSANGGTTIGSLIHWAEQDGWINPRKTAASATTAPASATAPLPPDAADLVTLAVLDRLRTQPDYARMLRKILEIEPCVK